MFKRTVLLLVLVLISSTAALAQQTDSDYRVQPCDHLTIFNMYNDVVDVLSNAVPAIDTQNTAAFIAQLQAVVAAIQEIETFCGFANESASAMRTYEVDANDGLGLDFSFAYPLEHYSVNISRGASSALFPGGIHIEPNDSLLFRDGVDRTYDLFIAVREVPENTFLNPSLFPDGAFISYAMQPEEAQRAYPIQLGGVPGLRIDDLPYGQVGITTHIITIKDGFLLEILVESFGSGGNGSAQLSGEALFEAIIDSFSFGLQ